MKQSALNKSFKIGTYPIGHINVDLLAWPNRVGGEFYFAPTPSDLPRIRIGLDDANWDECLSTLLHEVLEFALTQRHLRFQHSGDLNNDQADYRFFFDHSQFGDVCSDAAQFLLRAFPDVADAYNKKHKKKAKCAGK